MTAIGFRPDIQGLRTIAVLVVMVFHFNPAFLPGGFVGVDVFLVISGYLITSILLRKKNEPDYELGSTLWYFYSSRIERIAPAYFAMLMVVALLSAILFLPEDFNVFSQGLAKAAWFGSNNYFAGMGDYFAPANYEQPLLHTWSLAVELQFYLIAPFLILLLSKRLLSFALAFLLIGLTLTAEYRLRILGVEQATYYSLYARLPEFFAGALAALYHIELRRNLGGIKIIATIGLFLIFFATLVQPKIGPFPGLGALLPILGTVLILISNPPDKVRTFLSHPIMVWLGGLSYSLYLWHWPTLALLRYYTGLESLDLKHSLIFGAFTFLLSLASYYWLEAYRKREKKNGKYAIIFLAVTCVLIGVKHINNNFIPSALPIEFNRYADPAKICHGTISHGCLKGNLASEREILVLGDSHAAMLNIFFDYLGNKFDFKARVITASSCITIPGFDYSHLPEWARSACFAQINNAASYLEGAETVFIAGAWDYQISNKSFKCNLINFLERQSGKKVYILSQVPRLDRDARRLERFKAIGFMVFASREPSYQLANEFMADIASGYSNVEFLELDYLPVFSSVPFYRGGLIYKDEHHLNEIGSKVYAESAAPAFSVLFKGD